MSKRHSNRKASKNISEVRLAGFTFNSIVIVQSLEPSETQTGSHLYEYIVEHINYCNLIEIVKVEIVNCSYAGEFEDVIENLVSRARNGMRPILHVECHGDQNNGLEFANGSTLSWENVSELITPLNRASGFNLLAIFSACFGGSFLTKMGTYVPAPCWCLVAPTDKADPGELMGGLRGFYDSLLAERTMTAAVQRVNNMSLSCGQWLWQPAESWYEMVVKHYIEMNCKKIDVRKRAMKIHRAIKDANLAIGIGAVKKIVRSDYHRSLILKKYFEIYFMISDIPENKIRFKFVKARIEKLISVCQHSGEYDL